MLSWKMNLTNHLMSDRKFEKKVLPDGTEVVTLVKAESVAKPPKGDEAKPKGN